MNYIKKIPTLRFQEFNDEWHEKKLGDVGELINGLTYSPNDIRREGLLVLRSSNMQNDSLDYADCVYVGNNTKANVARIGDIIICVRNGSEKLIGKNEIIKKTIFAPVK